VKIDFRIFLKIANENAKINFSEIFANILKTAILAKI